MIKQLTKAELFDSMVHHLDRLSPYIITEIDKIENLSLFQKTLQSLETYAILEDIESPKTLFDFLKKHQKELVIIRDDIFLKRKNYLEIVQGAVCSSPDSMALWTVYYLNERGFIFKGKIILCTNRTKQEIKADKKWEYFARDCHFI
jgi:hypothetical protein